MKEREGRTMCHGGSNLDRKERCDADEEPEDTLHSSAERMD